MRIGIDARLYGSKQGGLGRYVEQLIQHLEQIDEHNEYVVFLRKDNWDEFKLTKPNFKKAIANIPWYSWSEQLWLPLILKIKKLDLMHFPHWNVPLMYNKPFIVTVHDLIMYHYPRQQASTHGPMVYWFKDRLHRLVLKHAAKKAKQIITPTEFTKQDIHKTLKTSLDKIMVIHLAPYANANKNQSIKSNNILRKYNINKPFVLYVGVAYPHKNLDQLIQAWKIFQEKYGNNYQLVLVGKKNYFYNKLINKLTNPGEGSLRDKQINNIVYTDYLTDQSLDELYAKASLYIFPSLYEGFGLPPLEAMAHGVPVASSTATCLPEILGDATIYFDPNIPEEMVRALHLGLHDQNLRQRLKDAASRLLTKYSWEKTARQTLRIYQSINEPR